MNETPDKKRRANRKDAAKTALGRTKAVAIDEIAYGQVAVQAKKLKMTKSEYASAAISYFAESGLDPTAERPQNLASINMLVSKETLRGREQTVEAANRLIQIIRGWEKGLYGFLQQQQLSTNTYLELIESNLLQHLVAVETNLLAPLVEQLFKVNLEASITRGLAVQAYLKLNQLSPDLFQKQEDKLDQERDQQLALALTEFIKTNTVPRPRPTAKRAVTPVPPRPGPAAAPTNSAAAAPKPD
jgi:hypothetical protein